MEAYANVVNCTENVLVTLQIPKVKTVPTKQSNPKMATWQCPKALVMRLQQWDPYTQTIGHDINQVSLQHVGHQIDNIKAYPCIERLSFQFQRYDGSLNKIFSDDGRILLEYKFTNQEFDVESCKTYSYPEEEPREILNIVPKK